MQPMSWPDCAGSVVMRKQINNFTNPRSDYYPDFEEAEVGLAGILLDEQKPSLAVGHFNGQPRFAPMMKWPGTGWLRLSVSLAMCRPKSRPRGISKAARSFCSRAKQGGTHATAG